MYTENLELNELHKELGGLIISVDLMELKREVREAIKYALFNAAEIVSEVLETLEDANTKETVRG